MRTKTRLLTPGPTPLPEEVRLALAKDMIHHRKDAFQNLMKRVQKGLQYLFQTNGPVLPLSCSGTGAMTAAVTNLFAPGETVLVVEGGKFGQRWSDIAGSHGLEIVALPIEWGRAVQPREIENALSRYPEIKGVLIQASETSTGALHPIREIGALTAERDIMLVVDGISAVGISPCPMDEWKLDCLLTGSQKGLMLPPGLACICLSERAWNRVESIKPRNFYFNLLGERTRAANSQTLFTSAVNLMAGLEVVLEMFQKQTLHEIFRKQWAMTRMVRTGVQAMGLTPLVKEGYTWGLTSIALPPGIDGGRLLQIAAAEHGVIMAGGQDQLKGRIVRIGHMGYVDFGDLLAGLYALKSAFTRCGGIVGCRDYLEQAAQAYESALELFDQGELHD